MALYDPQQHSKHAFLYGGHDPGVCCKNHSGLTLWLLGYPDRAVEHNKNALRLARKLSHSFSIATAHHHAGWIYCYRRDYREAAKHARALMELARENRFSLLSANASIVLGRVMVEEGRPEEGLAEIQEALNAIGETGLKSRVGVMGLFLLAEAYRRERQTEKGLAALAKALAIIGPDSDNFINAELARLKGEFLLGQAIPAHGDAEACFRRAIEISRRQNAKSLELRAVTSLSRLLRQQAKTDEAREMLAEIYGWFTEGFDTADLKEAKALLEELS